MATWFLIERKIALTEITGYVVLTGKEGSSNRERRGYLILTGKKNSSDRERRDYVVLTGKEGSSYRETWLRCSYWKGR